MRDTIDEVRDIVKRNIERDGMTVEDLARYDHYSTMIPIDPRLLLKLCDVAELGEKVRTAQKAYFRARQSGLPCQDLLEESKRLEKLFDAEYEEKEPSLF